MTTPLDRRASLAAGALVVTSVLGALSAAPASAAPNGTVRAESIVSTCRADGLDLAGSLVLSVAAGSVVVHDYRVFRAASPDLALALGHDETPVPAPVEMTVPFSDPQFFGPGWGAGLPFTYEQRTAVSPAAGAAPTFVQVVQVTCTVSGAGAVSVTEPPPAPTTTTTPSTDPGVTPSPTATAVVGRPGFTG